MVIYRTPRPAGMKVRQEAARDRYSSLYQQASLGALTWTPGPRLAQKKGQHPPSGLGAVRMCFCAGRCLCFNQHRHQHRRHQPTIPANKGAEGTVNIRQAMELEGL